jgi:fucose permease
MAHVTLLALIYLAFISLGLPDSVLGVAWPSMRVDLGQPLAAAGLVTLILTACSALSSLASAAVLNRLGTGVVVMLSGLLTGLGLLGFAFAPSLGWVLVCAVPLGLGAGSVDAGLNHFVADHYSSRHMNWLHGCWGVGATVGPVLMGAALVGTGGWQSGYRTIAVMQLALALLFLLTLRLWQREHAVPPPHEAAGTGAVLPRPVPAWATWLAPALYLVYATVEIGTGLWAASILVDDRGLGAPTAGLWVSCFFGAIMGGRFAIGLVAARLGNRRLVRLGVLTAMVGALVFATKGLPDMVSLAGLVLLGLGCAPIYPSLMHETTRRFDAATARKVVGRQVAFAYVGGAIGPACLGLLGAYAGLVAIMPAVLLGLFLLLFLSAWLDRVT